MARPVFYTPVKRSHVVAPFGVGALMLARNGVGVVVCGLDEWMHNRPNDGRNGESWLERNQIVDAHLQHRLGVNRLIQPPTVPDEPQDHNTWFVRAARFPLTEYCINPKCRRLVTRQPEGVSQGSCSECDKPETGKKRAWPTQQTPLVLACRAGHLSDIPWLEWTHDPRFQARDEGGNPRHEGGMCAAAQLTYQVATDITAPRVECLNCKAAMDLGAFRNARHDCPGERPWLPGMTAEVCEESASVVERTATRAYFADMRSALHLPHGPHVDHRLMALLAEPVARIFLKDYEPGADVDERDLQRLVELAAHRGIATTPAEVGEHVRAAQQPPADVDESAVRVQEMTALLDPTPKTSSSVGAPPLVVEPRDLGAYSGTHFSSDPHFRFISAVPRLAETRALVGFSRIDPVPVGAAEGFVQQWGRGPDAAEGRDWLVAHRVYGEGILLVLEPARLRAWLADAAAVEGWQNITVAGVDRDASFVLAHTFAHALLREAAVVCGYSLPSLRERIYVTADNDGEWRVGALIYTADGDAYGTLGGLVELADPGNLEALVASAIESVRWCGADPVCMHPPEGAGLNTTPGCCHHCLLLPETSCEGFNQGLDRATLIGGREGTPGFFT